MPPLESKDRYQKAVYWEKQGDAMDGDPRVGAPEEIVVRWSYGRRSAISPSGLPVAIDATVIVNQEIEVGSAMWLGSLSEWMGTGTVGQNAEVMEVLTYSDTRDLKNRFSQRSLGLAFYKGDPPVQL